MFDVHAAESLAFKLAARDSAIDDAVRAAVCGFISTREVRTLNACYFISCRIRAPDGTLANRRRNLRKRRVRRPARWRQESQRQLEIGT